MSQIIQPLKFKNRRDFDELQVGYGCSSNMWRAPVGTYRKFVIYADNNFGGRSYKCVEALRVNSPSFFEGKDPWIVMNIYNSGETLAQLSIYHSEHIDYKELFE